VIYDVALQRKRGGKVHIARSMSKGAGWSYCGELFQGTDSNLMRDVDSTLVTCRACKEEELRERRSRPPGWWAHADVPPETREPEAKPADAERGAGRRRGTRRERKAARRLARRGAKSGDST